MEATDHLTSGYPQVQELGSRVLESRSWVHVSGLQLQDGASSQPCPPAENAY